MKVAEARRRIQALRHLNAFISLTEEDGSGPVVAVKDVIDVRGTVTTAGGKILPMTPASVDAPVIRRLREKGCVIVGKASLHEFAFGVTNANPHFGDCLNPHDPTRVPGGSSGGSAVAVAAGMCDWAIGSDTGGSIRIPASLCGVVGLKPTHGLVSTDGVIPLSWTLDTLGPLAPDVKSAARALEMMSGLIQLVPEPEEPLSQFKIAIPRGWIEGLDAQTRWTWDRVSGGFSEIPFPDRLAVTAVFQPILFVEAATYHRAWVESQPERYGPDVLDSLRRGLKVPGIYYVEAMRKLGTMREQVEQALSGWDALILPTTPIVAPPVGTPHVREPLLRLTRPFSLSGHPVVTIPAPSPKLPVGIQVVGHYGADAQLLRVARALESRWQSMGLGGRAA